MDEPARTAQPGLQTALQLSVEPLHHSICLQMVSGGSNMLNSQLGIEGRPHRQHKLDAPVGSKHLQDSGGGGRKRHSSAHLVDLSTIVKRCVNPSLEVCRGPAKSTYRCEKWRAGIGIGCTEACMPLAALQQEQPTHCAPTGNVCGPTGPEKTRGDGPHCSHFRWAML